jgi:hypothetical protein
VVGEKCCRAALRIFSLELWTITEPLKMNIEPSGFENTESYHAYLVQEMDLSGHQDLASSPPPFCTTSELRPLAAIMAL